MSLTSCLVDLNNMRVFYQSLHLQVYREKSNSLFVCTNFANKADSDLAPGQMLQHVECAVYTVKNKPAFLSLHKASRHV